MADELKAEELKTGHVIVNLAGFELPPMVADAVEVDPGVYVPIIRITFFRTTFKLLCNADRVFKVESSTPGPIPNRLT